MTIDSKLVQLVTWLGNAFQQYEQTAQQLAAASAASAQEAQQAASNAGTASSAVAANAAALATAYDSFDDRYLGAKPAEPTLDNDGDPLLTGAMYFDTGTGKMRVWDGSIWVNVTLGDMVPFTGRNLIINGSGRINQRAYVSGTATGAANQYTLDRWRVVVPGQSLTFTGDDSRHVMTAPAGGVEQVVEGAEVVGGSYVLNWDGAATATVNGVARAKGEVFTLPGNTHVVIRFTGGTFTDVQLESGLIKTPFEHRPYGQELALCQRYYVAQVPVFARGTVAAGGHFINTPAYFPVQMRGVPTLIPEGAIVSNNVATDLVPNITALGFLYEIVAVAGNTDTYVIGRTYAANAEL